MAFLKQHKVIAELYSFNQVKEICPLFYISHAKRNAALRVDNVLRI